MTDTFSTDLPSPDDFIETFPLLSDWEERYAYLIDLGRSLPPMEEALKTDEVLVTGCTSRVWLVGERREDGRFHFFLDSDAAIVKGLCAVLMVFVQDKTADEIRTLDMQDIFTHLGLETHISPNRRNGFFAMVERVRMLTA